LPSFQPRKGGVIHADLVDQLNLFVVGLDRNFLGSPGGKLLLRTRTGSDPVCHQSKAGLWEDAAQRSLGLAGRRIEVDGEHLHKLRGIGDPPSDRDVPASVRESV
jgi:hypothetical protein